jgi:hypothetical protein
VDAIVVRTNADMEKIIQWSAEYRKGVANGEIPFNSPFMEGEIIFWEEGIKAQFKTDGQKTDFNVWFSGKFSDDYTKVGTFSWCAETEEVTNKRFFGKDEKTNGIIRFVEESDNTFWKIGIKYVSLMLFAAYYRPELEANKEIVGARKQGKKPSRGKKQGKNKSRVLYNRRYIINENNVSAVPKRKRGKCDHEFSVRGQYRHYSTGKTVWVKSYMKNVGKKSERDRKYIAKVKEEKVK